MIPAFFMTTETTKLKAKLGALDASLTNLEDAIAPLLEQPFAETLADLTALERAKLQTLVPYLVYDLVFIYLKAQGLDPKTHPVVEELNRVKEYFGKISSAENPETPSTQLDKGAATRFIKHAIARATYGNKEPEIEEIPPSTFVPVKVTEKMREREEYQKELANEGSEEEDSDLEIINEEEMSAVKDKGKGKAVEQDLDSKPEPVAGSKRRRPMADPFAGYGDDEAQPSAGAAPSLHNDEELSQKSKKKNKGIETEKGPNRKEDNAKSPKKKKKKTGK
ncbi:C1D-domain-containing protein [Mycena indigotica]|uniref:Exosome complex protein n=1 Tax=Mycena indigotica TaxID=2126181 RepID=A0A8H6SWY2_9AGAR|nr:C1D-domain-containing protein [Mycena indigotica]KAF7307483.1 C1D-domain-containing protein [Mycena indigotica]